MKTLLLIAALVGVTSGTFAQQKTSCARKIAHHGVAHKRTYHRALNQDASTTVTYVQPQRQESSCFAYRQHNIAVTECPGIFYDNSAGIDVSSDRSFTGNYMQKRTTDANGPINANSAVDEQAAPQHTNISTYRGVAPEDGNFCRNCR